MKTLALPLLLLLIFLSNLSAQDVILKDGVYLLQKTGKPYTGVFKEYDATNKLLSETSIKDGLLDGNSTIYYPSGSKKEIRAYRNGKKEGSWTNWNEAGLKTAEAAFKNGKKDGFWYVWDDKGITRYEMFYSAGEKKGTWIIRDEQGKLASREEFN